MKKNITKLRLLKSIGKKGKISLLNKSKKNKRTRKLDNRELSPKKSKMRASSIS